MGKQRKPRGSTNRRGGKPSSKPRNSRQDKDISDESEVREFRNSRSNPFELYNANPLLTENAAKINTNNPLGTPYNVFANVEYGEGVNQIPYKYANVYEAGVAAIGFLPTIGPSEEPTSPANVAFNNVYSYVRHANSGARNYDSASLGMYMMAMDSAYMWYELLVRLYGTMNLFSAQNRYYPRILVQAQGFNFDDLVKNIPALQFRINRYAKVLSTIYMPHFNIIDRHKWCCGNYFVDHPNAKAQTYLMRPIALYMLQETGSHEEEHDPFRYAVLDCVTWSRLPAGSSAAPEGNAYMTMEDIHAVCDNFEKILTYSSDVALISGDIAKAYDNNVMRVDMVPDIFELYPKYDETVLHMIHNATMEGTLTNFPNLRIQQEFNEDGVYWYVYQKALQPYTSSGTTYASRALRNSKPIIDFKVDDPSKELIVEGTRLTSVRGPEGSKSTYGTEIVTFMTLYYFESTGTMDEPAVKMAGVEKVMVHTVSTIQALGKLSAFNYAPAVHVFNTNGTTAESTVVYVSTFFDVDNYTVVDYDAMRKLHEAAVLSEWNVPQMPSVG